MADVNKIKLPDSSEYNIKDYRIPGVDMTPTSGSDNVVTSGGVYTTIKNDELVISTALNDLNDRLSGIENTTIPTKVSDLTNDLGFTSNTGTLTGVSFNGLSATVTNGVASITATIPAAVTESTVSGWGFTKNTGTLTDVTVGGTSVVSNGTAAVPAIPIEIINIGSVDLEQDTTFPSGTYTQCSTAVTAGKTVVLYIPNDSVLYLSGVDTGRSALTFFAFGTNAFQVYLYNNDTFSVDWVAEDNWHNYINTVKVNGTALTPDTNNAVDITVPAAVTESTVSGWGFTKNTGTYSKPSGGIPATDLASAVQTSLGKADTALQSFTETDPTVPTWAKQSTKPTYTAAEVGALPDTTVIPTVPTTVSSFTNDVNYVKYVLCADETAYNAISSKDSGTLYLIPKT